MMYRISKSQAKNCFENIACGKTVRWRSTGIAIFLMVENCIIFEWWMKPERKDGLYVFEYDQFLSEWSPYMWYEAV